jgi:UDP-N-acetylmuramate dehydrogenase
MNAAELIAMLNFACESRLSEPMSKHTSLGLGGPAEVMAFPEDATQLAELMKAAREAGVPVFIFGNGTNLLARDGGIEGLVVNLSKMNWISIEGRENETALVRAGAGTPLPKLASFCAEEGLCGLEFSSGIPGTVGGAVYMNAGAYGYEIKDVLYKIQLINEDGEITGMTPGEAERKYRHGGIPQNSAVTEAWFKLTLGDPEEIKARAAEYIRKRKASQPLSAKSAGSTFKNPPGMKSWQLIEGAGLKGLSVGGAAVSDKHANFLINTGKATAKDFIALMELVKAKVKDKTGIELEPEVKIVGKD